MHLPVAKLLVAVVGLTVLIAAAVASPNGSNKQMQALMKLPASFPLHSSPEVPSIRQPENSLERQSFVRLLGIRGAEPRTCFYPPKSPEVTNQNLETCCWYDSSTCCNKQVVDLVMPNLKGNLTQIQKEVGLRDECYFAIADVACMICAPNSADFLSINLGKFQIRLCDSLCDKMFSACRHDLAKLQLPNNTANGEQFCGEIFKEIVNNGNIVFGKKGDASKCFEGVALSTVEQGYCLPGQTRPSDDDNKKVVVIVVVVVVVTVVLLLLGGVGVAFFVWRRRQAQQKREIEMALSTMTE